MRLEECLRSGNYFHLEGKGKGGKQLLKSRIVLVLLWTTAIPLWSQSAPVSGSSSSPQAEIPVASAPIHVSEKDMRHFVRKKASPVYSQFMLQTRIQGTVVLRVVIDTSGVPIKVSVVYGHPVLLPATIDAAKQWRYKPYLVNGNPVEVETENTFRLIYPR
jgi:TonB family protein